MKRTISFSYRNGELLEFAASDWMAEELADTTRIPRWLFVGTEDGCALVRTTGLVYVQITTHPEEDES